MTLLVAILFATAQAERLTPYRTALAAEGALKECGVDGRRLCYADVGPRDGRVPPDRVNQLIKEFMK